MFSGIIDTTSKIRRVADDAGCRKIRVAMPRGWSLRKGQSISIDGICSTVTAYTSGWFDVEYMQETLAKTTAAHFLTGRVINLERSLRLRDYVDGHLVQGHIDSREIVRAIELQGVSKVLRVILAPQLLKFVAPQGSITINGVSLTVVKKFEDGFSVALIPFTLKETNLGTLKTGDSVNIEVDMFARYMVAMLDSNDTVAHYAKAGKQRRARST